MKLIKYLGKNIELNLLNKLIENPDKWFKIYELAIGSAYNRYKDILNILIEKDIILKQEEISTRGKFVYKINKNNKIVQLLDKDI